MWITIKWRPTYPPPSLRNRICISFLSYSIPINQYLECLINNSLSFYWSFGLSCILLICKAFLKTISWISIFYICFMWVSDTFSQFMVFLFALFTVYFNFNIVKFTNLFMIYNFCFLLEKNPSQHDIIIIIFYIAFKSFDSSFFHLLKMIFVNVITDR